MPHEDAECARAGEHLGQRRRRKEHTHRTELATAVQRNGPRCECALGPAEIGLCPFEIGLERFDAGSRPPHSTSSRIAITNYVRQAAIDLFQLLEQCPLVGFVGGDSFTTVLNLVSKPLEFVRAILRESLDGLPGIEELAHGQDWIEGYARAVSLFRGGAFGIGIVLGLAALLIVANTIRLAFYARRDELDILALVGASRTFVRVPFLLEGTLQGLLGGLVALVIVYGAYELLLPQVRFGLELVLGRAELRFFTASESIGLVASGAGLGLLGSMTALVGWRSES
jgi:hypothetical protein